MHWEVAQKAIDMFFLNISNNPTIFNHSLKTISLYGGEPLLNFHLIKRVVEYIQNTYGTELKQMGSNFQYSLVTNGTLITKDIAGFLAQHKKIAKEFIQVAGDPLIKQ
jgi:uncharacterized protein